MLYRHVFDKISTEFCSIFCVFVNLADLPEFHGSATAQEEEEEALLISGMKTAQRLYKIKRANYTYQS